MKTVLTTERIPIKMWLDDIEGKALQQAINLANLPFAFKHIALMPDAHMGYGMPIGGVLATDKNVIIPNAVGVDIGCGMMAAKTKFKVTDFSIDEYKKKMQFIRDNVPIGFEKRNDDLYLDETREIYSLFGNDDSRLINTEKLFKTAVKSLGTLGGGNHFIEFQKDEDNFLWFMIHSGSRNIGKQVADYYNKKAIEMNEKYYSSIPKEDQLAFLIIDDENYHDYFDDMNFCVYYAALNRELMMNWVVSAFDLELNNSDDIITYLDVAHNYAKKEKHYGKLVNVHRKGAVYAGVDETVIIPGSQGTCSYIGRGLGNRESFNSCSHGAGRLMGRRQAQKILNYENEIKKLEDQNIIHSIRNKKDLDEASGAYKDIDIVMENQKDLVEITTKLTPIAVLKG